MQYFPLDRSNPLNLAAAAFIQSFRTPALNGVVIFFTNVASPTGLTVLAIIVALILWFHGKTRHMVQLAVTLSVGALIVWLIKISVQLPRPAGGLIPEDGYSFVSGHATYAVIFFALIAYAYKSHIQSRILRLIFLAVMALLAFLVGMSRIYLGVHYFTDVLGGFILGGIVAAVSIMLFERCDSRK